MKTSTYCRMFKVVASMLALLTIGFVNLAQAADAGPAFDHSRTGFILRDVHRTLKCEQCHIDGIFKNTPKDCAGCHATGTRVSAKPKPINHVPTTAACDTCHISATTFLVKSFSHVGITGGCSTCHNGQSLGVMSKPAAHIPTNLPCESCHKNTSTFLSWTMDHTGITSGCASCHTGQFPGVVSQPAAHIPTNGLDCGNCHGTPPSKPTFAGATFNHPVTGLNDVTGICGTCHGVQPGVKARSANHIPTLTSGSVKCDDCHTNTNTAGFTTFNGVLYHQNVAVTAPSPTNNCSTCHTGNSPGVQGTSSYAPHTTIVPPPTAQCDTCHNTTHTAAGYTSFLGATFTHPASVTSPGLTTGPLACATCHNGTYAQTYAQPHVTVNTSTTTCASCHTTALATMSWLGASFIHPSSIVSPSASPTGTNACGTCHNGTSASTYVSPHVAVNTATTKCDSCHTTALATLSWLGASFNHAADGITSTQATSGTNQCASCHNGTTAQTWVAPHVATNASTACDSCHTTALSTYSWLGATFNHAAAGITSTQATSGTNQCASCHNGTAAQTWVPPHVNTSSSTACDLCHTTALASYSWLGASFNHAAASPPIVSPGPVGTTQPACAACHNGTNAATYVAPHVAVTTATTSCASCHTTALATQSWLGATFNHTAQGISSTQATSGTSQCSSCHNGTNAQTWVAPHVANATPTVCDSCHTTALSSYSWLGATFNHTAYGVSSPGPTGTTGLACAACHNGTQAQTYVQPHVTVNTATTTCASCHTTAMSTYSWLGAVFVHPSSVISPSTTVAPDANACATCHNGVTAATFVAPHAGLYSTAPMSATVKCDDCHTNALTALSWTGMTMTMAGVVGTGTFVHTDITGYSAGTACATCHSGTYAQGKPATHMVTAAACNSCHSTAFANLSWLGAVGVDHSVSPLVAGTVSVTSAANNCAKCHNGTIANGLSAGHIPVGTLSCDAGGCHVVGTASTFAPGLMGATQHTTVVGTVPLCSTCHNGSYASQGLNLGGAVGMVTTHIPTTSITPGLDCTTCHIKGFVATAGVAAWSYASGNEKMNHNGAQGGGSGGYCVTCHLSGVTYLETQAQKKNHNGSSTAKDCSSSSCHKPLGGKGSTYSSWS